MTATKTYGPRQLTYAKQEADHLYLWSLELHHHLRGFQIDGVTPLADGIDRVKVKRLAQSVAAAAERLVEQDAKVTR